MHSNRIGQLSAMVRFWRPNVKTFMNNQIVQQPFIRRIKPC